ncbi:MAG: hypothetical protein D6679_10025 [Candidatus Hydrogenedentota bacterium]|nr:MAG: hypothetical protein D6679_10025 [Candidatus Hydrogenedentota bacterium]
MRRESASADRAAGGVVPREASAPRGRRGVFSLLRDRARGQALIVALILLLVAAVLVLAAVYFFRESAHQQVAHTRIIQERYLAEAGLELTLHRLNTDHAFSREIQILGATQKNPFDTNAGPGTITWEGGTITVVIEPYE